jgi:hypothetical protein
VVVRVRDQYGNALPGATVTANASGFDGAVQQTDGTGRTAFEFNTSGVSDTVAVNVTVNETMATETGTAPFDQSTAENATTNVTVRPPSRNPGSGPGPGPRLRGGNITVSWDTSAMNASTGVDYYAGNDTLVVNRTVLSINEFTARANATNTTDGVGVSGVELDFASSNGSVVDLSAGNQEPGPTNVDGELASTAGVPTNGLSTLSVFGAATSDSLQVKVIGASDPGPPGERAFADADGDGVYDSGETTYTASDLKSEFEEKVDLVIPSDVGGGELRDGNFEIKAVSITSEVDMTTTSGSLKLKAEKSGGGSVNVNGTTLTSASEINVVGQSVNAAETTMESNGGSIAIKAEKSDGGPVRLSGSRVVSSAGVTTTAAQIEARNLNITAKDGSVELKATKSNNSPITASGIQVTTEGGNDITLEGKGLIDVSDSATQQARLTANGGSIGVEFKGGGSSTFRYTGVEISDSDDTLEKEPDSVNEEGPTESGSVA